MTNAELQEILKQYPDDWGVSVPWFFGDCYAEPDKVYTEEHIKWIYIGYRPATNKTESLPETAK